MPSQAILNHINQNFKIKLSKIYNDEDKTDVYSLQKYENKEQVTIKKRKITLQVPQQVAQQVPQQVAQQVAPPEKVIIKDMTNKVYNSWYSLLHSEEIEPVKPSFTPLPSPKLSPNPINPLIFLPNQTISINRDPIQKLSDFLLADDYQIPEVNNTKCCNENDCFFTHVLNH
jgi:hypothetical protein